MTAEKPERDPKEEAGRAQERKEGYVAWKDPRKRERGVEPNKVGVARPDKVG